MRRFLLLCGISMSFLAGPGMAAALASPAHSCATQPGTVCVWGAAHAHQRHAGTRWGYIPPSP